MWKFEGDRPAVAFVVGLDIQMRFTCWITILPRALGQTSVTRKLVVL